MKQNTSLHTPFRVSITVPCLNESKNIGITIKALKDALEGVQSFEIIIINDGSTDDTQTYLEQNFQNDPNITIINHSTTLGRGFSIKEGFRVSKYENIICFNGKHDISSTQIASIFKSYGTEDLIISYQANTNERPFIRRFFSKLYTAILNLSFGLSLKYYNGSCIIKRSDFDRLELHSNNYALDAEILIKLIKSGTPYREVPVNDIIEKERNTRSTTIKNILGVFIFYLKTVWEIHFLKRRY